MKNKLMYILFLVFTLNLVAQTGNDQTIIDHPQIKDVIPQVKEAKQLPGVSSVLFDNPTIKISDQSALEPAQWLASIISTGFNEKNKGGIQTLPPSELNINEILQKNTILFNLIAAPIEVGKYEIRFESDLIRIKASDKSGFFNSAATLIQLFKLNKNQKEISNGIITDYPDLAFRGYMHDVGRNFQSIVRLKEHINILSEYKLNVFHWHLSDNPAWRVESKIYPQLNRAKYHRETRNPGAFYTFEEIREVINFAASRGVMVIPELDMPGHSKFFNRTFKTKMNSRKGMRILERLLEEFCEEIPVSMAPYLHIGSDEVHITNKAVFMHRMSSKVKELNRIPIVWNPGLEPPKGTILQIWSSAAVRNDWQNIDSSGLYSNNMDPILGPLSILKKDLCSTQQKVENSSFNFAAGAILCTWNDVKVANESEIYLNNPVYTGSLFLAQRSWTNSDISLDKFEESLLIHQDLFFNDIPFFYTAQNGVHWKYSQLFNQTNKKIEESLSSPLTPLEFEENTLNWGENEGSVTLLKKRALEEGIAANSDGNTIYLAALIFSETNQKCGLLAGWDMPARANRQYGGLPPQGKWCPYGSTIILNGEEVQPPHWENPGKYDHSQSPTWHQKEEEIPWTAEELYWLRQPVSIELQEGWNTILVKTVKGYKDQTWISAVIPVIKKGINYQSPPGISYYSATEKE